MSSRPDTHTAERLAWLERIQDDPEISAAAFGLAFAISRHLNRARGDAWPSQKRLGTMAGVKERQVRNLLKQLVERHHLTIESGGFQRPDRYRPSSPDRQSIAAIDRQHSAASDRQPFAAPDRQSSDIDTGTGLPPNPLKEPFEKSAARSGDEERLSEAIFALLPRGATSRSNRNLVGQAVASIIAEGINPKSLTIAVSRFVKESPDATDQDGRFMGKAHEWLTIKRGWEAFTPSPDALFAIDLREADRAWVHRVRAWLRHDWTWKPYEWGPAPGMPGCRVPAAIIEHCRATEPANDAALTPAAPQRRVACA